MSPLVQAIKQCVGNIANDSVHIFLGMVTDNSLAISDGTISVQQMSGKNITNIQTKDMNYSFNQQSNDAQTATDAVNSYNGPLIFDAVELQASIGDAYFVIPKIGSHVRIAYSKYQPPFVLQIQDIQSSINSITDDSDNFTTLDQSASTYQINSNNVLTTFDNLGVYISTNNAKSEFILEDYGTSDDPDSPGGVKLSVNNGATVFTQTDMNMDLSVKSGAEITLDTLVTIKNQSDSLGSIMQDLLTAILQLTVTTPSGPSTLPLINSPSFIDIQTRLSTLLS